MNYRNKAGIYATQENCDHFSVDKNYAKFQFPPKKTLKKKCHFFFTMFFDAGVLSFVKLKMAI